MIEIIMHLLRQQDITLNEAEQIEDLLDGRSTTPSQLRALLEDIRCQHDGTENGFCIDCGRFQERWKDL